MLRDYEILYIVRPELDDEQFAEATRSVDRLIENLGGKTVKTDIWGRRRLAYEVRHLREGQYVLTDFQIEPARVPEMEATLKISDTVFRHLIVRKADGHDGQASSARPTGKDQEKAPAADDAAETQAAEVQATEIEAAEPEGAQAEEQNQS